MKRQENIKYNLLCRFRVGQLENVNSTDKILGYALMNQQTRGVEYFYPQDIEKLYTTVDIINANLVNGELEFNNNKHLKSESIYLSKIYGVDNKVNSVARLRLAFEKLLDAVSKKNSGSLGEVQFDKVEIDKINTFYIKNRASAFYNMTVVKFSKSGNPVAILMLTYDLHKNSPIVMIVKYDIPNKIIFRIMESTSVMLMLSVLLETKWSNIASAIDAFDRVKAKRELESRVIKDRNTALDKNYERDDKLLYPVPIKKEILPIDLGAAKICKDINKININDPRCWENNKSIPNRNNLANSVIDGMTVVNGGIVMKYKGKQVELLGKDISGHPENIVVAYFHDNGAKVTLSFTHHMITIARYKTDDALLHYYSRVYTIDEILSSKKYKEVMLFCAEAYNYYFG